MWASSLLTMGARRRDGCGRNRDIRERNGRPPVPRGPARGRATHSYDTPRIPGRGPRRQRRRGPGAVAQTRGAGLRVSRASRTGARRREMIPAGEGHKNAPAEPSSRPKPVYSSTGAKRNLSTFGGRAQGVGTRFLRAPSRPAAVRRTAVTRRLETEEVGGVGYCRGRVRVGRFLATSIPGEAMGACPRSERLMVGVCARSNPLRFRNATRQGVAA
jgi:hypothetical protein